MPAAKPLPIGSKFNRLRTIALRDGEYVRCRCICGTEKDYRIGDLRAGRYLSCGCRRSEVTAERNSSHGMADSPEYAAWLAMKARCKPTSHAAKDYRDRGISVCRKWLDSFEVFFADVGRKPSPQHTLERKNNSKGYSPGNVRWATRAEQNRNTRQNVWITCQGITLCLTDWAKRLGISRGALRDRIKTHGAKLAVSFPRRR